METGDPLLPSRRVADSRSEMTELVLPNDANTLGNLLGGRLMHYIDLVGAIAAYRHASEPMWSPLRWTISTLSRRYMSGIC